MLADGAFIICKEAMGDSSLLPSLAPSLLPSQAVKGRAPPKLEGTATCRPVVFPDSPGAGHLCKREQATLVHWPTGRFPPGGRCAQNSDSSSRIPPCHSRVWVQLVPPI